MDRPRVIQWGTGNTGVHALRSIIARDDIELAGVRVFTDAKDGVDAGDIAGVGRTGIIATKDIERILSVPADCVLYMVADVTLSDPGIPDSPTAANIDEMCRILESGRNVVTTALGILTFPQAVSGDVVSRLEAACQAGQSAFVCVGIDPGFMNDFLPTMLSGFASGIRSIKAQEILNYSTWNSAETLRAACFGVPPTDDFASLGSAGLLSNWRPSVMATAHQLGVELDDIRLRKDFAVAPFQFDTAAFTVEKGHVAAQKFRIEGVVKGEPVIVVEHVTRLHDDIAPDWPRMRSGAGGFRIVMDMDPPMIAEIALARTESGAFGDPCVDACHATGARAVNAVPVICAQQPGVYSQWTLPRVTGRGLFNRSPENRDRS